MMAMCSLKANGARDKFSHQHIEMPAGFGILFWAQFLTMVIIGVLLASGVLEVEFDKIHGSQFLKQNKEESVIDLSALWWVVGMSILAAPMFTVLVFSFMSPDAVQLIQASIYLAIGINVFLAVPCVISHAYLATIGPALMAFFTYMYAKYVWYCIPYAGKLLASRRLELGSVVAAALQCALLILFIRVAQRPT
jgi:hypothetical protein